LSHLLCLFNATATHQISTLSLHDALPISPGPKRIAEHCNALVVLLILLVDGAPNETRDAEGRIVAARYLLDQNPVAVSAGVEIHPISPEREHTGKRPRNLAQLIEKLRRDIGHPDARACDHLDRPQTPWVTHWKGLQ